MALRVATQYLDAAELEFYDSDCREWIYNGMDSMITLEILGKVLPLLDETQLETPSRSAFAAHTFTSSPLKQTCLASHTLTSSGHNSRPFTIVNSANPDRQFLGLSSV